MKRRVLIVRKSTNLQLHGETIRRRARSTFAESELEKLRIAHEQHVSTLRALNAALAQRGIEHDDVLRNMPWPLPTEDYDAVLTVGGDGTLLSASHSILDQTIVAGIRSSESSVGFLCAYDISSIDSLLDQLTKGTLPTIQAQRLCADVFHADSGVHHTTIPVLNDFLFASPNPASTTRYRIRLNGVTEDQKSSGVWISTAVGTTAAILAAGGTRLAPDDMRCQYRVRELFIPPNLGVPQTLCGGLFDPESDQFFIESTTDQTVLALDGQHGEISLGLGDTLTFKRALPLRLAVAQRA